MAAEPTTPRHHMLSVLVENKSGVLARISGLFARRAYNIFSLAVAPTEDPKLSRLTVVVDAESAPLEQVVKQLNKLINVIKITELHPGESVQRELMIVTVKAEPGMRKEVMETASMFTAEVLDASNSEVTFSIVAEPERLDSAESVLGHYGIMRVQRSGRVALPRLRQS